MDEDLDEQTSVTGDEAETRIEEEPAADEEVFEEPADEEEVVDREPSRYRRPAFAVLRAVVILAVAAAGYQAIVPSTHVVRGRLANLVVTRPGVKVFDVKPAGASEQPADQSGVAALVAAAKRSPNDSGEYSTEWTPAAKQAAGLVVFLLPDNAQAATALTQLRSAQMGAQSYSSDSLARTATFSVGGVPGSSGSLYAPGPKAPKGSPGLSVTAFRYGRVVALSEVLETTGLQGDVSAMSSMEYAHLRSVEPGFSLQVTTHPTVPTIGWIVGAVLLAALASLGPVGWRRRAQRRERDRQAELERLAAAPAHGIVKRRR